MAIDLLSEQGGTGAFADPAQATAALGAIAPEQFVHDLNSAVAQLKLRVRARRSPWSASASAAVWCGNRWPPARWECRPRSHLWTVARQSRLHRIQGRRAGYLRRPRHRVTGSQAAAKAALGRAGLVNDLVVEPDADHAFFNDTCPCYNAVAAADAWQRLLDWFGRYLT